jgi:hypothetical protein
MARVCPKCGKDFSTNPYWTTDLKRHLARKNPCDRPADWKFVRAGANDPPPTRPALRCLDSVEWAEPISPPPGISNKLLAPWLFREVFRDPANVCFVKPNSSKNEVWVKVTKDDPVRIVRVDDFIGLFVKHVLRRLLPRDFPDFMEYDNWLYGDQFIDLNSDEWRGDCPEFIAPMRLVLNEFLRTWPGKTQLKNMLVNFV